MTQLGKVSLAGGDFPFLVYASSQALFPIMGWFLYSDAEKFAPYFPLNIAGKCISILLSGIWLFNSVPGLNMATMTVGLLMSLGLTLIIMFTDIISILALHFVRKGLEKTGETPVLPSPESASGDNPGADHNNGGF